VSHRGEVKAGRPNYHSIADNSESGRRLLWMQVTDLMLLLPLSAPTELGLDRRYVEGDTTMSLPCRDVCHAEGVVF